MRKYKVPLIVTLKTIQNVKQYDPY